MNTNKLDILRRTILNEFRQTVGIFSLAFKDISDIGVSLYLNENEQFHAASTMKTFIMVEIFIQADKGIINLKDEILVKNKFKSIADGSFFSLNKLHDGDETLYQFINRKMSIYELVYHMITSSSNLAANILIETAGTENIMRTIKSLGLFNTKVLRGVEDLKAFELGQNNLTTAYDLSIIFEKLVSNKIASVNSTREMIDILLNQKYNDIIPAKLPPEIQSAHKTGTLTGAIHDSGIVFLPDGRKYILVILSKQLVNLKEGIETSARVSKIIYDYFYSNNLC